MIMSFIKNRSPHKAYILYDKTVDKTNLLNSVLGGFINTVKMQLEEIESKKIDNNFLITYEMNEDWRMWVNDSCLVDTVEIENNEILNQKIEKLLLLKISHGIVQDKNKDVVCIIIIPSAKENEIEEIIYEGV